MQLKVDIELKQVEKEVLFKTYKRDQVIEYCKRCNNYGENYSCPEFSFDTKEYLSPFKYATIILTKISTESIKKEVDNIDKASLSSTVLANYTRPQDTDDVDIISTISMYAFNNIKDQMTDKLLEIEKEIRHSVGLPPGSCTRCVTCYKKHNKPCKSPDELRYSLEALGFMVSDIYNDLFNMQLGWVKGEFSDYFHSCSALMTKDKIDIERCRQKLKGMTLTF